ncbi:MAG TPA: DUF2249 domain-containing protein [Sphingobacteriaceae bacterium]
MVINSQTKIAALIKHHPEALEAIITLSPDFKKLRNPILRKLMAGRTSIAMASKIGGCTPQDFFDKLKPYGFEAENLPETEEEVLTAKSPLPEFIKELQETHIVPLDVRAMLAGGNDPLKLIQQTVKELKEGQVLKIINTFEPTPLIKLLGNQGFQSYTDIIENDHIETYFYKTTPDGEIQLEAKADKSNDWDEIIKRYELQQLDVRPLEMPMPMITILESLEKLAPGTALYVTHKRVPVFLLTELKDRKFDYRIKEITDGEVHLLIFKN